MLEPLAYEFAPRQPGYPELESVKLAAKVDRFDANKAARAEMAKRDFLTLAMVFAVTGLASFTSLCVVAAVVDQGRANIKSWVAANEPV
jgi:hypothetical protein